MLKVGSKNHLNRRNISAGKIINCRAFLVLMFVIGLLFVKAEAQTLNNNGFEGTYNQIPAPTITACNSTNQANITGEVADGWIDESSWADVEATYSRETANPHTGASAQKVEVRAVRCGTVQMLQPFTLQKDKVYNAGIWLKGTSGSRVTLTIMQRGVPYYVYFEKTVEVTSDWREVKIYGFSTDDVEARFQISSRTPGTFYVDDAALTNRAGTPAPQLPTGAVPATFFGMHANYFAFTKIRNENFERPFRAVDSSRATITGKLANGWADNSDWADVTVDYSEDTNAPHGGTTSQKVSVQNINSGAIQLINELYLRRNVATGASVWLRGTDGMQVSLSLRQQQQPNAVYAEQTATLNGNWQQLQISGIVSGAGKTNLMIRTQSAGTFWIDDAVLTNSSGQPVAESFPPVGFKTLRLWDAAVNWSALEPQKGQWDFSVLDRFVNEAQARNMDVVLTLGQSPSWASARPGDVSYIGAGAPAEPRNIQDWRDYVSTVATRYRGRIKFYEIWNEPNDPTFYSGSVQKMVELTNEAAAVLKSVDATNTVISPPPYTTGWLDEFLALGGANNVDVIGYHVYSTPPEGFGSQLANARLVIEENGLSAKPLWNTEGATGDRTIPDDLAAGYLVRAYLVNLLYGAKRYNWYMWERDAPIFVNTVQEDNFTPNAAGNALGVIQQWLVGATIRSFNKTDNNWLIELTLANGTRGWIVWNPDSTVNYPIPTDWNAQTRRDLYGSSQSIAGSTSLPINSVPILIESAPPVPTTFADGTYKITAKHSGKALDVYGFSTANEAVVHQWDYFGQTNQKWRVRRQTDGSYRLTAVHSGKVLDAAGAGTADGTRIWQYTWNGSCAQKWRIENRSDGAKTVRSTCSDKVLDVLNASQANGAVLQLWTNGNNDNQAFIFERLGN
jgi:Ricin-type beta-trefoil lectin domain-like/Glycosyl hydrolases family 39/Carbohydrate binding domain